MKKLSKIFLLFAFLLIITGCSSVYEKINYSDLKKALEKKESFILEIVQDGCSNCEKFTPKFKKILSKYNLKAKQINLTELSKKDNNDLSNLYNVSGTPTVIFISNGVEESISKRIVGNVDEDKVISKLKVAGYIK